MDFDDPIYQINCEDSNSTYIDLLTRKTRVRINEHDPDVRHRRTTESAWQLE